MATTGTQQYHFLNGGGEMGTLIRGYNWSGTGLGSPGSWPVSLRTAIGIVLSSNIPMSLWWGAQLTWFYNDACRRLFPANTDDTALGKPAGDLALPDGSNIKQLAELLRANAETICSNTATSIYPEGQREDVLRSYCYSAVWGDAGDVDGVLMTCTETIDQASQLHQIAEAKEQLEFALEATELGIWDLNPATGTFKANSRLKDWFGLRPDDEISLDLAVDVIAKADKKRVADAINLALQYHSGGKYDIEYTISAPSSAVKRIVKAKGRAWFGEDKVAYRFNGTLQDVTAEREAQRDKAAASAMVDLAVKGSGIGIFNISLPGGEMEYSPSFAAILTGDATKKGLNRKTFVSRILPEDEPLRAAAAEKVAETGEFDYEPRIVWDDGSIHYVRIMGIAIQDGAGNSILFSGMVQDVTEQRTATQRLEASEARFRSIIEEAPVATCLFVGRELRVEVANEMMLGLWGKDHTIKDLPLAEAVPILKGQPFLQILDDVFTTGIAYEAKSSPAELEVNGVVSTYYFDFTYKPLRNAAGEVYAIMDMAVDVTAQVRSRQELEASEQFSRSIFYNSPVAKLVYVGPEMVLREANEKMLQIFGRGEDIIGKPVLLSVPELAGTALPAHYRRVLETGETYHEYAERIELIKKGQSYCGYYDYTYKALRDISGVIYGVICTAVEVTEQVEAMQKLALAESNMRSAIELAQLGTWGIDAATGAFSASPRLQFWFGFREGEDVYNTGHNPIQEKDRDSVAAALAEALRPGSAGVYDTEYTIREYRTGRERILHAQGKVILDESGVATKLSGTVQDVTAQRQVQLALENLVQERTEELAASNEELQAINEELAESNNALIHSNEELAQYAYVASHDLQEPLRKIQIFSGIIEQNSALPENLKMYMVKITSSAQRMSLLIRDLLDFSRLLKSDSLMQPIDLHEIATAIVADFELVIAEKAAVVNVGDMPVIQSINLQMNQLFYNLLGNALKFNNPDVPLVITVSSALVDNEFVEKWIPKPLAYAQYHHITVADNGIGFDNKYAEQIFEVFKRLHGRDIYPGSGIGLALCRRIVANHNGVLFAESEIGKGSVFHVLLPDRQQPSLAENAV